MSNTRKSIFDLERRVVLSEEYNQIICEIQKNNTVLSCIKTWPYRQAAINIESFANKLGFSVLKAQNEGDYLYSLELLINLLHWLPEHERKTRSPLEFGLETLTPNDVWCTSCIENIEWVVEKINMRVRVNNTESTPRYYISKRDADVDAAIESIPELSEILLSYLDIRNQKDESAKKTVLKALADYLEPLEKNYKGTAYAGLCDNLFTVFNKCSIRHNDKNQWKLRKPERMGLYDQTFKASIHLLQAKEVKEFKDAILELKQRFEQK